METTSSPHAAIYTRISSDKTGEKAGVDRQEADCRELAKRLGWEVTAVYVDNDISAYSGKIRPGYREMLDAVRSGELQAIVAWHPDRLHRRNAELEGFISLVEAHSLQIQTVQAGDYDLTTSGGRMVARILGAAAQHEVDHARERITRAKKQMAVDGKFRGGPRPFGYEKDGVTIRESEAKVIRELTDAVLAGRSLISLSKELNAKGVQPATVQRKDANKERTMLWRYGAVRDLLLRPRNAGLMAHGLPTVTGKWRAYEEIGKAGWPAIIPEEKWRALVAVLADPARRTIVTNDRSHLGSGIFLCGLCGAVLRPSRHSGAHSRMDKKESTNPHRSMRPLYRCSAHNHLTISEDETNQFVLETVAERIRDPRVVAAMTPGDPDLAAARAERSEIVAALDRFDSDYTEGRITAALWQKSTEAKNAALAVVDDRLARGLRRSSSSSVLRAVDPGAAFLKASLDVQRAVIAATVKVEIRSAKDVFGETGWVGRAWNSDRVRITPIA